MPALVGTTPVSDELLAALERDLTQGLHQRRYHEAVNAMMPNHLINVSTVDMLALVKEVREQRGSSGTGRGRDDTA